MSDLLGPEELANWLRDPTTLKIRKNRLEKTRQEIFANFETCAYGELREFHFAQGRLQGHKDVFDIEADEIPEEE